MIISLSSPSELLEKIADHMRERRLSLNLTQEQLARQANVSLAVLRKFERTGKISLESFIKLVFVLGLSEELLKIFHVKPIPVSLDELLQPSPNQIKRKRASTVRKKIRD